MGKSETTKDEVCACCGFPTVFKLSADEWDAFEAMLSAAREPNPKVVEFIKATPPWSDQ